MQTDGFRVAPVKRDRYIKVKKRTRERIKQTNSELRSCVKVEVAVLGSRP